VLLDNIMAKTLPLTEPRAHNLGGGADPLRSLSNGNLKTPQIVNEAYRRLVLDAPSLLRGCEMPVARLLFTEWLAEKEGSKN
jgi:hypothetical protein